MLIGLDNPEVFLKTNIIGTYNLLESSRSYFKSNFFKDRNDFIFHHISTDEVFGNIGKDSLPVDEFAKYKPNSPYSSSKAGSDHLVNAWYSTYTVTNNNKFTVWTFSAY